MDWFRTTRWSYLLLWQFSEAWRLSLAMSRLVARHSWIRLRLCERNEGGPNPGRTNAIITQRTQNIMRFLGRTGPGIYKFI